MAHCIRLEEQGIIGARISTELMSEPIELTRKRLDQFRIEGQSLGVIAVFVGAP